MSIHESRARNEADRRGWKIERYTLEIGATGVPCFVAPNTLGKCNVWVGTASDSDELEVNHTWQQGAPHPANIRGLSNGRLYDRQGDEFKDGIIRQYPDNLVMSFKLNKRDYDDAWDALNFYVKKIYSLFLGTYQQNNTTIPRPYPFDIPGDQLPESIDWRSLVAQERIAIVGLGGVGAWIADFVIKADPSEVNAWDHDSIEPKNILRMPGGINPNIWIGRYKADWFLETYSTIHNNIHGHRVRVVEDNIQELVDAATFVFVAVDKAESRNMICDTLAKAEIPFVVAGLSLMRKEKRVKVAMRVVTSHVGIESWREAVPQVGQAGQDDYGSLELPDVYSLAASFAIQSWRKSRGQIWQENREECLSYRVGEQSLIVRSI